MKLIKYLAAIIAFVATSLPTLAADDTVDEQGYPYLYVRGTMTQNWSAQDAYKLTRDADTYSIHLDNLDGEFKIAGDNWQYNYGAAETLTDAATFAVVSDGANIYASNLTDVTITVRLVRGDGVAAPSYLRVSANGHEAPASPDTPVPDPDPVPDAVTLYAIGNFNGWNIADLTAFTTDANGVATLNITGAQAGDGLKISTVSQADWTAFDSGVLGVTSITGYIEEAGVVYALRQGRPGNITLPAAGDWTVTVYWNQKQIVLTQAGQTVPGPVANPVDPEANTSLITGTLPVLYINVYTDETKTELNNEIIDFNLAHKNYFSFADYWLDVSNCQWMIDQYGVENIGSADEPLPLEIKARGNYTRIGFAKKPFKLKLGKKQSLLGLSKSKHFAIIAHADDNYGYLRNFTGFNLGRRIGLPWTPNQQPVEVVINGDYRGLYFLTESIRIESGRIDITELDDNATDPALASGGYLVELDNYDEDNQIRLEEKTCVGGHYIDVLRVTYDTPELYSDIQHRFVSEQFDKMNTYVGTNSNELWRYMDLDDAARYYIVEEIVSHTESYHGSTYMFRDRGENQKWHFSPLWDFGNAFNGATDNYFYNCDPFGNTWIPSMRINPTFNKRVSETWKWFMTNRFDGIYDDMQAISDHIAVAAKADHRRWQGLLPNSPSATPVVDNSDIQARTQAAINHIKAKVNWLKGQNEAFGDFTGGYYVEPERDNTEAAPLPEYVSGVSDITVSPDNAPVRYYNLQGIEIAKPAPGTIAIRRQGTKATKVLVR